MVGERCFQSLYVLLSIQLEEVAQTFKEQGNEYFKGKRYREALGFYKQGIDALPTDPVLLEALLCNRAACNLELRESGDLCMIAFSCSHVNREFWFCLARLLEGTDTKFSVLKSILQVGSCFDGLGSTERGPRLLYQMSCIRSYKLGRPHAS